MNVWCENLPPSCHPPGALPTAPRPTSLHSAHDHVYIYPPSSRLVESSSHFKGRGGGRASELARANTLSRPSPNRLLTVSCDFEGMSELEAAAMQRIPQQRLNWFRAESDHPQLFFFFFFSRFQVAASGAYEQIKVIDLYRC